MRILVDLRGKGVVSAGFSCPMCVECALTLQRHTTFVFVVFSKNSSMTGIWSGIIGAQERSLGVELARKTSTLTF